MTSKHASPHHKRPVFDRSHALRGNASRDALRHIPEAERGASLAAFPREAWECRQGRSAFRFWDVTQSVTG
ncbi:hypothetical protein B0E42_26285, partial [Pseudomonas sp. A25(2017)]